VKRSIRLSPNRIDKWLTCGRQYWYYYEMGWRARGTSATLFTGDIVGKCIEAVVNAKASGVTVDPVQMFEKLWHEKQIGHEILYNTKQTPDGILKTGKRLMELFPDAWDKTGLVPLTDRDGKPFVERGLTVQLTDDVSLYGIPDIMVISTQDGSVGILDFKAPEKPYDPVSIWQSDQLTHYQILGDAHRERLGIEQVDWLSYMQLIRRAVPKKRGVGPEVLSPGKVPRRSEAEIVEYKRKALWVASNIQNGYFPKTPRKPHNTPCTMCDYVNHCTRGSCEGLIIPETKQVALL
jgi:hypothetical protein